MSPRINSGDIVIISPNTPVTSRSIAAVTINDDDRTLKTVHFLEDGTVLLKPENEAYDPIIVRKEYLKIIGRVVERRERF